MDEMNNNIVAEEVKEEAAASEEVAEVALAEEIAEQTYDEFELSGLTDAQRRRREIFDHITTGILILLLCSPIAILAYIFLWFILR